MNVPVHILLIGNVQTFVIINLAICVKVRPQEHSLYNIPPYKFQSFCEMIDSMRHFRKQLKFSGISWNA